MKVWCHDPPRQFFARVNGIVYRGQWLFHWAAGYGAHGWRCIETRDYGTEPDRAEAWRLARLALSRLVNEQHARTS